ncbi:hypothetical protein ACFQ3W_20300 [Paenibacillus puldeungensis]|uniref:Uncharacterized protein n=1 Tax=Paenibacillus puldeungensis TaxID=696536 RepID=A0ABW3S2B2_9BACL
MTDRWFSPAKQQCSTRQSLTATINRQFLLDIRFYLVLDKVEKLLCSGNETQYI